MELLIDVSCGDWLLERVGVGARVDGVAGAGFEAYARILHPAPVHREDLAVTDEWGMHPVLEESRWAWAEVAARQGLTMHPLVQWNRLADVHQGIDFADGWRVGQTQDGHLDLDLLAGLAERLAEATAVPEDLVVGLWRGWGELTGGGSVAYLLEDRGLASWLVRRLGWRLGSRLAARRGQREAERRLEGSLSPEIRAAAAHGPHLKWPDREMVLFATSTQELSDPTWVERAGIGVQSGPSGFSPQLIWPADHAWVVASEIDWDSTIVAGSRTLVDAVLADERFEAFEVGADADLRWEGDLVNPPRAGWPVGP